MNKQCKEYINEVKSMFPVKGIQERKYIKNLKKDIEDYCEEANTTTKDDLYENYGNPIDIVSEYFSATGTSYVIKKIRFGKYIRTLIAVIIALVLIVSSIYCAFWYENHLMSLREEVIIVEDVIT